jgi:biopolymer transport protein ExbB/TolQ
MLTKEILDWFACRNQYSSWKEVIKDKQSLTFEAREFEEEVKEIIELTLKSAQAKFDKFVEDLKKEFGSDFMYYGKDIYKFIDELSSKQEGKE